MQWSFPRLRLSSRDHGSQHLRAIVRRSAALGKAQGGVAALEFAIFLPVLIGLLAGLYDFTAAFMAWRRVTTTAQVAADIATALAANADDTNTLSFSAATKAASVIYAYLPATLSTSGTDYGVVLSSVVMTPLVNGCTSNCTYTAHVAWSGVFQGAGALVRPCDVDPNISAITPVSDTSASSPNTLPEDTYAAMPLLVVDVSYRFRPLFLFYIIGDIQMHRSAYYPTRAGRASDWVHYNEPGGDSLRCPGWPA